MLGNEKPIHLVLGIERPLGAHANFEVPQEFSLSVEIDRGAVPSTAAASIRSRNVRDTRNTMSTLHSQFGLDAIQQGNKSRNAIDLPCHLDLPLLYGPAVCSVILPSAGIPHSSRYNPIEFGKLMTLSERLMLAIWTMRGGVCGGLRVAAFGLRMGFAVMLCESDVSPPAQPDRRRNGSA